MDGILKHIHSTEDIKNLNEKELKQLCRELRRFLLQKVSKTGGHLASNLGIVELTVALEYCFHLPEDKIVWDVGHQAYIHKMLTGRKEGFDHLRQLDGLSGFPKPTESDCDAFAAGHSSTSISAAFGLAKARDLTGGKEHVIAVIGDGSMTGGLAYEALNNVGKEHTRMIVILNDNQMSIAENVGGLSQYLNGMRSNEGYNNFKAGLQNTLEKIPVYGDGIVRQLKKTKSGLKQLVIPGMFFEDMGITYLGPVDGHNIDQLIRTFNDAKKVHHAVLIHVCTKKGKGYEPAERHPSRFHGAEPFVIETGLPKSRRSKANYTDIFSTVMRKLGDRDEKVVAITAAMPDGTGLKRFKNMFPDRFFDVGIAEQHAVTFAAGLAAGGLKPVVAVYSSFLQRAYDQVLHDVCIQNLHVIFAIDRAGLVGSDGETHQGIFDLSYLSGIPNMTIMAPKNKWELSDMMKFAVNYDGPIALRYPRGEAYDGLQEFRAPIAYGRSEWIYEEADIALMAVGSMVKTAEQVRDALKDTGYNCTLINARFVKPIDEQMLEEVAKQHKLLVTLEENVRNGGFGDHVLEYVNDRDFDMKVLNIALPDEYVEHGNVALLYEEVGIDAESVTKRIIEKYVTCPKEDGRR